VKPFLVRRWNAVRVSKLAQKINMHKIGDYIKLLDRNRIVIIINEDDVYYLTVDHNGETYHVHKRDKIFIKKSGREDYVEFIKKHTINVANI